MKVREQTTSSVQNAKRGRPVWAASCAEKYLSVPSANAQPSAQDFYSSEREPQEGNRRATIRGRCRVDRRGEVEAPAGTVERPSCECALPINMRNPGSRLGD